MMNSSFLYHAWGLCSLECTKVEYGGKTIILNVQSKKRLFVCPKCGKPHLVKNVYCVCGGGGANNYISTGKVDGINNKKSDEAKCIWI